MLLLTFDVVILMWSPPCSSWALCQWEAMAVSCKHLVMFVNVVSVDFIQCACGGNRVAIDSGH